MGVTHESPAKARGHPLWARRVDAPRRRGWLVLVLALLLALGTVIIIWANTESANPLTVSDATKRLAQLCDKGRGVEKHQPPIDAYGANATLECVVNGDPVYVYVFPYNVDAKSAVSAVSEGGREAVVIGSNWVAAIGPSLPQSRSSGQTATHVKGVFGGTIRAGTPGH